MAEIYGNPGNYNYGTPYNSYGGWSTQSQNYPNVNTMMNQNNYQMGGSQKPSLLCKAIQKEEDIFPNEVPNDGSVGFFVQEDMQAIYAKTFGRNGTIMTNVYRLVTTPNQEAETSDNTALILERLNQLEETIKQYRPKPYYKNSKKKPQTSTEGGNEHA